MHYFSSLNLLLFLYFNSGASDQVQSAVMRYLQKRRYSSTMTEAYKRLNTSMLRGQPLVQSKAQLAVRELLRSEAGSTASVSLSAPSNVDPLVIEQQYHKFKGWISESHDSYKPELAQLLYPMFTHLYLDLVLAGHKMIAQKFHNRHKVFITLNFNMVKTKVFKIPKMMFYFSEHLFGKPKFCQFHSRPLYCSEFGRYST